MFSALLPRTYELRGLINDPTSTEAYFQDFENHFQSSPHLRHQLLRLENEFQELDQVAWAFLRNEASQYLARKDSSGRGWQQLFDILGQARAYGYLKGIECSGLHFVPRSDTPGIRTPDLGGFISSGKLLCEVKTINISRDEVDARRDRTVRTITRELGDGFFLKLRSDVAEAQDQMRHYDPKNEARHFVYIILCFDDWVGSYKEDYFRQIEEFIVESQIQGIEVILRDDQSSKTVVLNNFRTASN